MNPYVLETIKTYCFVNEMKIEVIPEKDGLTDMEYLKEHVDAQTACVLIQHPNYYGNLEEAAEIGEITHGAGAKYVMNVNPISLGVVKTPQNMELMWQLAKDSHLDFLLHSADHILDLWLQHRR